MKEQAFTLIGIICFCVLTWSIAREIFKIED
jgi:hypothetical protein